MHGGLLVEKQNKAFIFSFMFLIVIPALSYSLSCPDGTPNFKCSTASPGYYCSYGQLVYGEGCAAQNNTVVCPDGTPNFKCSSKSPGYYCSYGQLVYGEGCAPQNNTVSCSDGTANFKCSTKTPGYYCSYGQLLYGQGCAPENNAVTCPDGTPNFKCSTASPGYYCSYGQLVYGEGCAPQDKPVTCPDGTPNFKCSTTTPGYYCSYGQLEYGQGCAKENNAITCPDGTPNFKCSSTTPGYYCSYGQLVYGEGCTQDNGGNADNQSSQNSSADYQPPVLRDVSSSEADNQTTFSLVADDSNTGNSEITSCTAATNGQTREMTLDGNGATKQAHVTMQDSEVGDSITFSCSDKAGNAAQLSFTVTKKQQAILASVSVVSDANAPIPNAEVYLDSNLDGYTGSDGSIVISVPLGQHYLSAKAKGFLDSSEQISASANSANQFHLTLTAELQSKFTPAPELQPYLSWSWYPGDNFTNGVFGTGVAMNPWDKQIKLDALSIMVGNNEVDAAKSMRGGPNSRSGMEKFINTYDQTCLQNPTPATCQAWHSSDYEIIQRSAGVCADWATLTTSFDNSMGLPTRIVYLFGNNTKKGNALPRGTVFAHAITEVYIPAKGWTTLDTLWEAYNDPCIYPRNKYYDCFYKAWAYLPDGVNVEDRTDEFEQACGLPSCPTKLPEAPLSFALANPPGGALVENEFNVMLHRDSADVSFTTVYQQKQYDEITSSDLSELPSYIPENLNATPEQIKNVRAIRDDARKSVTYTFSLAKDFSESFNQVIVASQFGGTAYDLKTDQTVQVISPDYDSKSTSNGITEVKWNFVSPGVHGIKLLFKQTPILVVYAGDLRNSKLGKFAGMTTGITSEPVSSINSLQPPNFSLAYVLGDYGAITSTDENQISQHSDKSIRLSGDLQDVSLSLFKALNKLGGTIVLASELDAQAINASDGQNGDALVLYNPDKTKELVQELSAQKPNKIILVNSTPVDSSFTTQLGVITKLEEASVQSGSTGVSLVLTNSSSTPAKRSNATPPKNITEGESVILLVGGLIVLLALAYVINRMKQGSKK